MKSYIRIGKAREQNLAVGLNIYFAKRHVEFYALISVSWKNPQKRKEIVIVVEKIGKKRLK